MVVRRTPAEWASIAEAVIVDVLQSQGAFAPRELEAKAAEKQWSQYPTVNPHHLTQAVARLKSAGAIELQIGETRGGGLQRAYTLAGPSKMALRAAGRKRLLLARYRSWASVTKDWNPSPVGAALERVVHASLTAAAPFGYRLLTADKGEVRELFGVRVPGGPLDNAAWFTGLDEGGMPLPPVLVLIEAKNLREWVYPRTQELYQLLDKAVSIQVARPDVLILPMLVCRRAHYTTGQMAKQVGFHLATTTVQYVRPVVAGIKDGQRKVEEIIAELGFDIALQEGETSLVRRQFEQTLPARIYDAAKRWQAVALHPHVPDIVAQLRDEELLGDDRTYARDEFAGYVREALSESDTPWASADHD